LHKALDHRTADFRDALGRRADYGEAANNLALVLVSKRQADLAINLLEDFLKGNQESDGAYVTLAKIYFSLGRTKEGVAVLERLLQRNPKHAVALELLRQWKGR
jgi:tetratricopeptide (TPR) repeat protein